MTTELTGRQVKELLGQTVKPEELLHDDFITRTEFVNRTGIFVSPNYYDMIYDIFKESGVSVDEFVRDYKGKYSTCVQKTELKGVFKYELTDDNLSCMNSYDETHEPNIWEIVNCLAMEHDHEWRTKGEITQEAIALLDKMQNMNRELSNIIYQYKKSSNGQGGIMPS